MMLYHASVVFYYILICSVVRTHAVLVVNCTQSVGTKGATYKNMENIAVNKPTQQSSVWQMHNSTLAVDNSLIITEATCAHTDDDGASNWTVTLDNKKKYNIINITLYIRDIIPERYTNMRVLIDRNLYLPLNITNRNNMPYPNPVHISGCDHQLRGNNITILVDNSHLTLCEVQVWACRDQYFGRQCENKCKCLNRSEVCDKVNGYCRSRCARGWQGDDCQTECPEGTFGDGCSQYCNCQNSTEICNKTTGACPDSGCKLGTYEPDCQTVCVYNTYGYNCSNQCGQCKSSLPCDLETGVCNNGCESGWMSERCDQVCDDGTFREKCNSACGHCQNDTHCDTKNDTCPSRCLDENDPPLCQSDVEPHSQVGAIVGGVVTVLVLMLVIVIGIVFFLRRRKSEQTDSSSSPVPKHISDVETAPVSKEDDKDGIPDEADAEYCNNITANIALDSLKQYIRSKTTEDGFEAEFQMIPYGVRSDHEAGKKSENKERNRFLKLFPYDHTRVKLSPDGSATWDYINASFVSGYSEKTTFIAAQGPNPVTVDDFWRMIWQQNVRKIVMLTRLVEMRKKKCEQYWPESNEKKQCGNITIETTESVVRADFTIRTFNINHKKHSETRTVTQFHFTSWSDHDVPSTPALVGFWKQVKLMDTDEQTGHPVVHCSAGVGRTGTFIALDSLVAQAETENQVNIFMCVAQMREARMNMVQTVDQYKFVYEALLEALESRGTLYTLSDFDEKYRTDVTYTTEQEEELRRQFQSLQGLKVELLKTQVSDALLPENVSKNRSRDILPGQRSRPFLTTLVLGCNDYINAVVLPSTTRSQYFIATQTPLPETAVDFWRLVYDHDCHTIVCLDDSQDSLSLYPREKTSSTVGPFTVETVAVDITRDSYVLLKMTLSYKDKTSHETRRDLLVYRTVFNITTSGQQDTSAILEFLNLLISNNIEEENLLVQCFDGSQVSGVFCSMMNVINTLTLHGEVDVFLTIRELQTVRPQFVSTFDQYKLCYDMVKEYSRSLNLYANM